MNDEIFRKLVEEALEEIPKEFKERIENVTVVVEEWPSRTQLMTLRKRNQTGMILGLYQGIPHIRRRSYGIGGAIPDKITIFRQPILLISGSSQDVKKNVKETVVHEIGHHFGLSDEQIYKALR